MGSNLFGPVFAALLLLAVPASAADCRVGTQVQLKGGPSGTILEIGTEAPHVGWYRIAVSYNREGEWFDPRTWATYRAGTQERCGAAAAGREAAPPQRPAGVSQEKRLIETR